MYWYSIKFYSDSLDSINVHCSLIVSPVSHFVYRRLFFIDINICTLVPNRKDIRDIFLLNKKIYTRISSNEILFTASYIINFIFDSFIPIIFNNGFDHDLNIFLNKVTKSIV